MFNHHFCISGYRLGTSGYTYPQNNVGGNEAKEVETDCFALCRQEAGCLGWGFYWQPDRSKLIFLDVFNVYIFVLKGMAGTCYLKGVLQQPNSDQRDLGHFTPGWKGGQNIFIDKGKVVFILRVYFSSYLQVQFALGDI